MGPRSSRSCIRLCSALGACVAGFAALVVVVAAHLGGTSADRRVWRWVVANRAGAPVSASMAVSHLGDPMVLVVAAAAAGAWLARRRSFAAGFVPLAALVAGSVTETLVKQVVGRPRPPMFARLVAEHDPSFPSGHTTGTAALLTSVALVAAPALRSRAARAIAVAVAGLVAAAVGAARLVLGVHWLTDVAAGWLLGTGWAIGVVLVLPAVERRLVDRRATPRRSQEAARGEGARRWSAGAG